VPDISVLVEEAARPSYDREALAESIEILKSMKLLGEGEGILSITHPGFFGWPSRYELYALKALRGG